MTSVGVRALIEQYGERTGSTEATASYLPTPSSLPIVSIAVTDLDAPRSVFAYIHRGQKVSV